MSGDTQDQIRVCYQEYLRISQSKNTSSEVYKNGWCVLTSLIGESPLPHRVYSFKEFSYWFRKKEGLYRRFVSA